MYLDITDKTILKQGDWVRNKKFRHEYEIDSYLPHERAYLVRVQGKEQGRHHIPFIPVDKLISDYEFTRENTELYPQY